MTHGMRLSAVTSAGVGGTRTWRPNTWTPGAAASTSPHRPNGLVSASSSTACMVKDVFVAGLACTDWTQGKEANTAVRAAPRTACTLAIEDCVPPLGPYSCNPTTTKKKDDCALPPIALVSVSILWASECVWRNRAHSALNMAQILITGETLPCAHTFSFHCAH